MTPEIRNNSRFTERITANNAEALSLMANTVGSIRIGTAYTVHVTVYSAHVALVTVHGFPIGLTPH